MKNNNQKIVSKLSARSMKVNRFRNIFAIIAIVLTSVLFTGTFTIVSGIISSMEQQVMRQVGTSAHAGLKDLTKEKYMTLKEDPLIKEASYNIFFSVAENKELKKRAVEMRYTEEKKFEWSMQKLDEGNLPKDKYDIVLDTITLNSLGIPAKIGEKVTLSYLLDGKECEDTFRLSGYYQGDVLLGASMAYFSKEYVDDILSIHTEEEWVELDRDAATNNGVGLIQLDVFFKNSTNIEKNIEKVISNHGYVPVDNSTTSKEIEFGVNWAYASTEGLDAMSILFVVVILLIIILAGYLMIYNIFYISVINEIRFYGLLKTIGTTGVQIRRLIRKQGDLLCLIGIPLGVMAGWLMGNALIPVAFGSFTSGITPEFATQPSIFLFGIIFSYLTVRISCYKPGKIAAKISPIEAAKYQENSRFKKEASDSKRKLSYLHMATRNLKRSKKKTFYVVASMSLGLLLFVTVMTVVSCFSIEKYVDNMLGGTDLFVTSASLSGRSTAVDITEKLDSMENSLGAKGIQKERVALGGCEIALPQKKHLDRYKEAYEKGLIRGYNDDDRMTKESIQRVLKGEEGIDLSMYGWNYKAISKLKVKKGELDQEKYNTGKYIVLLYEEDEEYIKYNEGSLLFDIGDFVTIGEEQYEVMAFVEMPHLISKKSYNYNGIFAILPFDTVKQLSDPINFMTYGELYEGEKEQIEALEQSVLAYTEKVDVELAYTSKKTVIEEFAGLQSTILLIGGGLTIFVGLIAVMNFVNSIVTGILTRKKELAMLKSIGMEKNQLLKMLIFESGTYLCYGWLFALILGSLISLGPVQSFASEMTWLSYRFSLWIPLISIVPLAILAVLVPCLVYGKKQKESIVELLREE